MRFTSFATEGVSCTDAKYPVLFSTHNSSPGSTQYFSLNNAILCKPVVLANCCCITIIWGNQVIQAAVRIRKDGICFALRSPSASEMMNWSLDDGETA